MQHRAIDREAGREAGDDIWRGVRVSANHAKQALGGRPRRIFCEVDGAIGDRTDRWPVILEDEQLGEVERRRGVVAVSIGGGRRQHHQIGCR